MGKAISVGQLRQNPTAMLREVKAGATYTITDHGEPVARVTGGRPQRWVPGAEVTALLRELGQDPVWAEEIRADRKAESPGDPWEPTE